MDKKEAVTEIKTNLKVKWKRKFDLSEKVDQIQKVFTEVGCRNCCCENDTYFFFFSCEPVVDRALFPK